MKAVSDNVCFPLIISLDDMLIISVFIWYPQTLTDCKVVLEKEVQVEKWAWKEGFVILFVLDFCKPTLWVFLDLSTFSESGPNHMHPK